MITSAHVRSGHSQLHLGANSRDVLADIARVEPATALQPPKEMKVATFDARAETGPMPLALRIVIK